MAEMTSKERFACMYAHQDADRIPIIDGPWGTTISRWQNEGMPRDVNYVDYFGLDHVVGIGVDNSPHYPSEVVEETDEYRTVTTGWGATVRNWKHATSTPEWIDFTVKDWDSWRKTKERIQPDRSRVNWDSLKNNYASWQEKGYWIRAGLWFGFDVTHSRMVGTERFLIKMLEDPEWCMDIFSHMLEVDLALLDMVWDEGYEFDCVSWPDDMGYKGTQFFSLKIYREVLKPYHKRAMEWAHAKGVKTHLHSCGNVNPLVPELIEIGLDGLNPLEVKAGMDPVQLKQTYGDQLVLHGGINAVLWDKPDEIRAEMEHVLPVVKESGGYIFSSDHSVPDTVSLEDFRQIVQLAKELGSYS